MSLKKEIRFQVNGDPLTITVPVRMSALTMLRDVLKMTGTKYGCGEGECGACSILLDGVAINACLMFAVECEGREVTTIEGVRTKEGLHALQQEFVETGAVQCGFCTPGVVMQGMYLIQKHPEIDVEGIKRGIEGNLCRCTGYKKIIDAIAAALAKAKSPTGEKPREE